MTTNKIKDFNKLLYFDLEGIQMNILAFFNEPSYRIFQFVDPEELDVSYVQLAAYIKLHRQLEGLFSVFHSMGDEEKMSIDYLDCSLVLDIEDLYLQSKPIFEKLIILLEKNDPNYSEYINEKWHALDENKDHVTYHAVPYQYLEMV